MQIAPQVWSHHIWWIRMVALNCHVLQGRPRYEKGTGTMSDAANGKKSHFSIMSLVRNALSYHQNWTKKWRSPEPKSHYDVIIVGGGGHGLATAFYLAKVHGITNVAVLEKGWIGGGNTGRNTTICRSN